MPSSIQSGTVRRLFRIAVEGTSGSCQYRASIILWELEFQSIILLEISAHSVLSLGQGVRLGLILPPALSLWLPVPTKSSLLLVPVEEGHFAWFLGNRSLSPMAHSLGSDTIIQSCVRWVLGKHVQRVLSVYEHVPVPCTCSCTCMYTRTHMHPGAWSSSNHRDRSL